MCQTSTTCIFQNRFDSVVFGSRCLTEPDVSRFVRVYVLMHVLVKILSHVVHARFPKYPFSKNIAKYLLTRMSLHLVE